MQPGDLGNFLGGLVVHSADHQLPEIQQLVGRDQQATRMELPLAVSWVCQIRAEQLLDSNGASETIRLMLAVVLQHAMTVSAWDFSKARSVMENRLDEYDVAASADGYAVRNVAKYFVACCEKTRDKVCFGDIIPDPDELQTLGDIVNADELAKLRILQNDKDCPTYSLAESKMTQIGVSIMSFAAAFDSAIADHC